MASPLRGPVGGAGRCRWGAFLLASSTIVLIALTVPLSVYAQQASQWLPDQPLAEGHRVFEQKGCNICHGSLGGTPAERSGPDLVRKHRWRDAMQFAGDLWNHTPMMTEQMRQRGMERPDLSPGEMGQLAAYLFYLQFLDEPGDAARGRELFEERSCSHCHQLGGRGGTVGPRLDELSSYVSCLFLAQALWNHGEQMAAKMKEMGLVRPRLEDDDVADIVAFIRGGVRPPTAMALAAAEQGSPRAGEILFRQKGCIKCHSIAGTGGKIGPDLGRHRQMPHLSTLAGSLWNHGPAMWSKMKELHFQPPRLSDRDMSDLLTYLYFVQYMTSEGDADRGAEIFRQKGCAQCHAAGSEGPTVGPDLATSSAPESPISWAAAMWKHAAIQKMVSATQEQWPRFADDEMRDLVTFLRSRN